MSVAIKNVSLTFPWPDDELDSMSRADRIEKELVFKEDPVALACAVYRIWQLNPAGARWIDFDVVTTTAADHAMSALIRKYYADRIMLSMLGGNNSISSFRRKLYGVVTNSVGLKTSELGLLYRLPYFYAEDTALDRVMEQTQSAYGRDITSNITSKFSLIETILVSRRSGDVTQLWLRSEVHPYPPFLVSVNNNNAFKPLIVDLLSTPVVITGNVNRHIHRGYYRNRYYFNLSNIKVAK